MLGTFQKPDHVTWVTLAGPDRNNIKYMSRSYVSAGLDWEPETRSMFWTGAFYDLNTETVEPHAPASSALYRLLGELETTGNCDLRLTAGAPLPVTGVFDLMVVPFSGSLELLRSALQMDRSYFDISYTMVGHCIVIAANGGTCYEKDLGWRSTDVYVLPVCSSQKETVQCYGSVKLERYFDIESGCRYVDLEINLKFNGADETVRVPLCLYADVYRPSALPLSTAPYSGQIDYMFRLALAYRSLAPRYSNGYPFKENIVSLINTAGLARNSGMKYWYDMEQIRHQLMSGIAEWESVPDTSEAFSEIMNGPATLTQHKLSVLFDMEIAAILSGTGEGIITREGWRPALNIPRLTSVARRYWMKKYHLPYTILEDGHTVLFLTKADIEETWSNLVWEDDKIVVLMLKPYRSLPVRPLMTIKDLKAMLAQYADNIAYPAMPETSGTTLEQHLCRLIEDNTGEMYKSTFGMIYHEAAVQARQRMVIRTINYFKQIL